jgi:nitrate reductase alpha subunit
MNIDQDSMTKVTDVNKRSQTTPDLRYSEDTEKWTINENIQEILGLRENGLVMYIAQDDNNEQVALIQIVDNDNADFYKGEGNIFTARRLADAVDNTQFGLEPVEDMDNTYALREWTGQSTVINNNLNFDSTQETETTQDSEDFTSQVSEDLSDFGENEDDLEEFSV